MKTIDILFDKTQPLLMVDNKNATVTRCLDSEKNRVVYIKDFKAGADNEREHLLCVLIGDLHHVYKKTSHDRANITTYDAGLIVSDWANIVPQMADEARFNLPLKGVLHEASQFLQLMKYALIGLKEIHAKFITHLDIKPDNICIPYTQKNNTFTLDFSALAYIDFECALAPKSPLEEPLTLAYIAKPNYQAPRFKALIASKDANKQDKEVDSGIDLFALGYMFNSIYRGYTNLAFERKITTTKQAQIITGIEKIITQLLSYQQTPHIKFYTLFNQNKNANTEEKQRIATDAVAVHSSLIKQVEILITLLENPSPLSFSINKTQAYTWNDKRINHLYANPAMQQSNTILDIEPTQMDVLAVTEQTHKAIQPTSQTTNELLTQETTKADKEHSSPAHAVTNPTKTVNDKQPKSSLNSFKGRLAIMSLCFMSCVAGAYYYFNEATTAYNTKPHSSEKNNSEKNSTEKQDTETKKAPWLASQNLTEKQKNKQPSAQASQTAQVAAHQNKETNLPPISQVVNNPEPSSNKESINKKLSTASHAVESNTPIQRTNQNKKQTPQTSTFATNHTAAHNKTQNTISTQAKPQSTLQTQTQTHANIKQPAVKINRLKQTSANQQDTNKNKLTSISQPSITLANKHTKNTKNQNTVPQKNQLKRRSKNNNQKKETRHSSNANKNRKKPQTTVKPSEKSRRAKINAEKQKKTAHKKRRTATKQTASNKKRNTNHKRKPVKRQNQVTLESILNAPITPSRIQKPRATQNQRQHNQRQRQNQRNNRNNISLNDILSADIEYADIQK